MMQASRSTDKASTKTRNREIVYFNLPLDDSTIMILSAYLIRCLLLIHVYFKLIMHAYTQQRQLLHCDCLMFRQSILYRGIVVSPYTAWVVSLAITEFSQCFFHLQQGNTVSSNQW